MNSSAFLDALEGKWHLRRAVTLGFHMAGQAGFTRIRDNVLRYFEEGDIQETRTGFTRRYDYVMQENGLTILFADGPDAGSSFLSFPELQNPGFPLTASARHLCGCDLYRASFNFLSPKAFVTRYDISGPRKDYAITTEYSKFRGF